MKNWTDEAPVLPGYYFAITASEQELHMVEVVMSGGELEAYPTGWECPVNLQDYKLWGPRIQYPRMPDGTKVGVT